VSTHLEVELGTEKNQATAYFGIVVVTGEKYIYRLIPVGTGSTYLPRALTDSKLKKVRLSKRVKLNLSSAFLSINYKYLKII